uniref:Uncharacterized protein n=1 Tax=Glossina brevipalpis TaxID=37001 RepID=A0A1A9WB75_9MUSC
MHQLNRIRNRKESPATAYTDVLLPIQVHVLVIVICKQVFIAAIDTIEYDDIFNGEMQKCLPFGTNESIQIGEVVFVLNTTTTTTTNNNNNNNNNNNYNTKENPCYRGEVLNSFNDDRFEVFNIDRGW